jgi:hypothetical protein
MERGMGTTEKELVKEEKPVESDSSKTESCLTRLGLQPLQVLEQFGVKINELLQVDPHAGVYVCGQAYLVVIDSRTPWAVQASFLKALKEAGVKAFVLSITIGMGGLYIFATE